MTRQRRGTLWICPDCGRRFANRNQTHTCGRGSLEPHFRGRPPEIRALYDAFVEYLRRLGPVEILPQKTRIAFHVRMSFAQLTPRRRWIDGHFVLAEPRAHPQVRRITTLSLHNHVHEFRLVGEADLTPGFLELMAAAYAVGQQQHLSRPHR